MDLVKDILKSIEESELSETNYGEIKSEINNILQKIGYKNVKETIKKLSEYRYCPDIHNLIVGRYVRYIPLDGKLKLKLQNGGIIINIKTGEEDILIICKNIRNRIFTVPFGKSIIFQKLTTDETIILDAIKYLKL
jgi:hypothetical protein